MKDLGRWVVAICAALMLPAVASAAADMYLQIKGVAGEPRVVACADGACVVTDLASGQYSVWVCDRQGKVIPTDITLEYVLVSPRDASSGQASGKRMHKPITIMKEWSRGAKPANELAINDPGTLVIAVSAEAVDAAVAKVTKSRSNIQNN